MFRQIVTSLVTPKKNVLPSFIIFSVTYACNSRCKHCFFANQLHRKGELTLREIRKISRGLGKLTWFHLSGGEIFLRDDVPEICKTFFKNNGAETIAIPTNCLMPSKIAKTTKKILEKCTGINLNVLLSLDGMEKVHDSIRGVKGSFKKVMETHKKLHNLQRKYKNLSITVCTTVMKRNYKDTYKLMDFVKTMDGVSFHSVELMRGNPRDSSMKLPSLSELKRLYKKYNDNVTKFYYENRDYRHGYRNFLTRYFYKTIVYRTNLFLNKLQLEALRKRKQPIPCSAGYNIGVIEPNGNVKLCELLPEVGNLRKSEYNFKKIWFSEKADRMRKFIKDNGCYCTHCLFLIRSMIFNPCAYPRLLKERSWGK